MNATINRAKYLASIDVTPNLLITNNTTTSLVSVVAQLNILANETHPYLFNTYIIELSLISVYPL